MSFQWQIPNTPPDVAVLQRMHWFRKPRNPMPEAWFMGDINFFTWLEDIPPQKLIHDHDLLETILRQIRSGLILFPKVQYIKEWKEWFLYLLPYILTGPEQYIRHYSE
jgi:hypothetical protein